MNNDPVIATINDLIACAMDGEFGFRASAEVIHNEQTQRLFLQRAEAWRLAAAELRPFVADLGGRAEDGGSAVGAVHRGWVAVKGMLAGYSDRAILDDTGRAEDKAVLRYQSALSQQLPTAVRAVVERQYLDAQRHLTLIEALRGGEQAVQR